jgi:cell division protease FtsH
MMGAERRDGADARKQKEMTAYHEAGHAIVGMSCRNAIRSTRPRSSPAAGPLGMVMSLPEMDRLNWHKDECEQKIAMTMAGKAAEILKYRRRGGLERAGRATSAGQRQLARTMVMRWGMSDLVGNIDYAEAHEGYPAMPAASRSRPRPRKLIEQEVKRLIDEGYETAKTHLWTNAHDEFERLAKGLLEYETLTGDEIRKVMAGEKLGGRRCRHATGAAVGRRLGDAEPAPLGRCEGPDPGKTPASRRAGG